MAALSLTGAAALSGPLSGAASDPSAFVRTDANGDALELLVRGAKCGGCIAKIEQGLSALEGVRSVRLNLSTGKLRVVFDAAVTPPARIPETLTALGYASSPFAPEDALNADDETGRALLRALAVAGFAAANIMLLSVSVWAGADGEMNASTRDLFHWISGAIAAPAALYAGRPFFRSALAALRVGRANMDVPISLAVTLALGWSFVETARGGEHAYFDAAVMLLFFLLIGRWMDHALRRRARAAARDLLSLQAGVANLVGADGGVSSVRACTLSPGDQVLVRAGERAPVDAEVISGAADVDMAVATGESAPVSVGPGARLVSGVMAVNGALTLRVLARAEDSFLADLARLVEAGEQGRSRYVKLADRAAQLYVPFVHSAAALTFTGWMVFGGDARVALMNAISLLIITCPCALALAVPAVQVVATGRLFKSGVLVKSGDALERLAQVDRAVFDKTGTLTTGRTRLVGDYEPGVLQAAARLARASAHPSAQAVADAAGAGPAAPVREESGAGIAATDTQERLGSAAWVGADEAGLGDAASSVWYRRDAQSDPVRFAVESEVRPGARAALIALGEAGVESEMLTGDAEAPAAELARTLGLDAWTARATPRDKVARLDALAETGTRAVMIGDGLNDAPALARAHVSISPGTAVEASQNAADIVFQSGDLSAIPETLKVARLARRRVLENFAFAALYNCCAVPLAAAGHVTPLVAAIAMSSSSLVVTLNALRLARKTG